MITDNRSLPHGSRKEPPFYSTVMRLLGHRHSGINNLHFDEASRYSIPLPKSPALVFCLVIPLVIKIHQQMRREYKPVACWMHAGFSSCARSGFSHEPGGSGGENLSGGDLANGIPKYAFA